MIDVSNLNLYINSPSGSVFEGIAIHNMLETA
ncbi:ATP-dependent Clp protease proteolytic subunit [Paenibacillus larvae]|nr:ATP-dependent Clp protease proteolytic subunit [Paenibacillus larvae]MDT2304970.1 ATP-dependent Clp protease proteolytic subunit [Paenibacillus larvae]